MLRTPQALSLPILPYQAVVGLTVLERGLTNFVTLLFVIFVGDRWTFVDTLSSIHLHSECFCTQLENLHCHPTASRKWTILEPRHLRQLEQVSYVWLKPVLFCLVISILAAVPFLWEVALVNMSREELDQVWSKDFLHFFEMYIVQSTWQSGGWPDK